jgi:hypothetical protein
VFGFEFAEIASAVVRSEAKTDVTREPHDADGQPEAIPEEPLRDDGPDLPAGEVRAIIDVPSRDPFSR